MDKLKNKELKKYIALVNYVFILILILMNLDPLLAFLSKLIKIFNPLIIAVILAFIINIPMNFIEEKLNKAIKKSSNYKQQIRLLSCMLAVAFCIFIVIVTLNLVIPELVASIKNLIQNISERSQIIDLKTIFTSLGIDNIDGIELNKLLESAGLSAKSLTEKLTTILASITGGTFTFITSAGGTIIDWMMACFICVYLLLKKEESLGRIGDFLIAILPRKIHRVVFQYLKTYYRVFDLFVGKRILESAILGIIEYLGCIIFGFPYAALIAVMTFILSIIPYFGCLIAVVIGFVLIVPVNFGKAFLFIIIFEIITIFESNVIYPRVVGKSLGLPEVWTLFGLLLFGALWGFFGMLIAVPITACIYISLSDFISFRKAKVEEEKENEEKALDKDIERLKRHKKINTIK